MKIVLVLGQMRSGGAAMAEALHYMGFTVGPSIGAPIPPTWRFDWEDADLSWALMRGAMESAECSLSHIVRYAERLGFRGVCLKQPYLAIREFMGDRLCGIVRYAMNFGAVTTIKMHRDQSAIDNSMAQFPWLSLEDNARIKAALEDIPADLDVHYEDLVTHPWAVTGEVANLLGVDDAGARMRAYAAIKEPTTGVSKAWPQSPEPSSGGSSA